MGAFFMYLFLLKLREKMGGEDPYDRMTKFVAPMIMPIVLAFCMFVPLTYLARLYAGESLSVSWYGFTDEIISYIADFFVFYLTFLSYLECKDLLRSLKVVHKPMIISALCLLFIPLLVYGTLFVSLFFGDTPLFDGIFPYGYMPITYLNYSAILIGFTAGMANMVLFYLKTRKPVEIKKEREGFYPFALFQFVTKISEVIGAPSLTIFRSAIEGYNQRFGRDIRINDTISLSDVRDYEWQDLLTFILDVYYNCIGPVTWEVAKEVEGLKGIKRQSHSIR
jgi:hypothetical protein